MLQGKVWGMKYGRFTMLNILKYEHSRKINKTYTHPVCLS